jgi:glycosyltransferase involved in cell wall biosynthesis
MGPDPKRRTLMRRVVAALAHPQHAGMLRALKVLHDAAPGRGWTMDYVMPACPPLVTEIGLPPDAVRVIPGLADWRRWERVLRMPATLRALAEAVAGADVLYSETLSTFPLCWLAGSLRGVPQVVHVYSSYGAARPYRKHWLARARHVVAPSADSLRLASDAVGGFRSDVLARVAYNGMDIPDILARAAAPPPDLALPPGPRVGMVGNLDWRKSPTALVEAAPRIVARVPAAQIVLVGAFPNAEAERRVRERATALGVADRIHVTGFLPNPFPVVRTLDVLAHPALRDPFPLALLEAMALERAIVASRVSGIPEMLEDGESGVLVPAGDVDALAGAIVALLLEPPRATALGAAARRRLETRFSLEAFADAMFAAFDDAATAGGR